METKGPVRRSQLIAPFGVGALTVTRDGVSVITCGLDHWYTSSGASDLSEFRIVEPRLAAQLGVDEFRVPPEFRRPSVNVRNANLTIPFLRFPLWHYCQSCGYMRKFKSTEAWHNKECPSCLAKHQVKRSIVQVPFVAICQDGHLQDFPWKQWLHRTSEPTCSGEPRLFQTGTVGLDGFKLSCTACPAGRDLRGITGKNTDGSTYLSNHLDDDGSVYTCEGGKPWLGEQATDECRQSLKGSLRSAANLYYGRVKSSISIPSGSDKIDEIRDLITGNSMFDGLAVAYNASPTKQFVIDAGVTGIIAQLAPKLDSYDIADVSAIVGEILSGKKAEKVSHSVEDDDVDTAFRREEFRVLSKPFLTNRDLHLRQQDLNQFKLAGTYFEQIALVEKLRETRAFNGFSRIVSDERVDFERRRNMLWRYPENKPSKNWLPGYVVNGEGLFFKFKEEQLNRWEKQHGTELNNRVRILQANLGAFLLNRQGAVPVLTARMLLIHTFAHVLMNQIIYSCGYSTASLRERLYISASKKAPMNGVLIYTAAGDSEGTMGGLVRMGSKDFLDGLLDTAIQNASWCSADPVCSESKGQGPNLLNLAACHNCALLPETSCEHFNGLLDRSFLIGNPDSPASGFFAEMVRTK